MWKLLLICCLVSRINGELQCSIAYVSEGALCQIFNLVTCNKVTDSGQPDSGCDFTLTTEKDTCPEYTNCVLLPELVSEVTEQVTHLPPSLVDKKDKKMSDLTQPLRPKVRRSLLPPTTLKFL